MVMRISFFVLAFFVVFSSAHVMAQDLAPDPSRTSVFGDDDPAEEDVPVDVTNSNTSEKKETTDATPSESSEPPPLDDSPDQASGADQSGQADPPEKQDPIDLASDAQIKEAQIFFKRCTGNEALNSAHDCRCLAVEFLGARVQFGNDVDYRRILSSIRSTCLKAEAADITDDGPAGLQDEYTDSEIKEAQSVYDYCENHAFMKRRHDCRCIAAKFLEERQEVGRFESLELALSNLRNECLSGVNKAGAIYSDCISSPGGVPPGVRNIKTYCECLASTYGKEFEANSGNMSMAKEKMMGMRIAGQCASQQGAPAF